ncbi:alpha/beta fold hydrolase [Streptomyces sp. enrichment culture]|uniref:alpha/beta fold hydrolase n=1 Tax=Streptomyces sp. enrichment culture TaxID=1795815 RepID=UPI003F55826A
MRDFVYRGSDGCRLHATALGQGPELVLLHGGGPDRYSLLPLARRLADGFTVVLPDIRGYGRSVCTDPNRHTWAQYTDDVDALLDHLELRQAALGGTGLGGTITLRAAAAHPERIRAAVVISMEDVEDDAAKEAETAMLEAFAARVREQGIRAAGEPVLPTLAPVIGSLVRDAIRRSSPAGIAAACAIGRDRAFTQVNELAAITVPTLAIPGSDTRHPAALAAQAARTLPRGHLAGVSLPAALETAADLAHTLAPAVRDFLAAQLPATPGRPSTQ